MPAVASSTIKAIQWNEGTMTVTYHKTGTYEYYEVPEEVFSKVLNAASIGNAMHHMIKGKYQHKKVSLT